ncbi:MAG TPA: molybdenum cofactor guanylyltransferase [Candidatus Binatia bacterium]|jgi:molybdopterin-guanine dinucleotide biosynthesis protein A
MFETRLRSRIDGVLIAGGRSRRFGADKRHAPFGSTSLAGRSLALLRACADGEVFVAGRGAFERPAAVTFIEDAGFGAGPLGGLVAALLHARAGVLVLPCDVPLLRQDTLSAVAALGRRSGRTVVARSSRGIEPLVAYYPRSALRQLAAGLREGNRALHRLLSRLAPLVVEAGSGGELANVNRPADLEAAARLRQGHEDVRWAK